MIMIFNSPPSLSLFRSLPQRKGERDVASSHSESQDRERESEVPDPDEDVPELESRCSMRASVCVMQSSQAA